MPVYLNRNKKMERTDYIYIFDRFLQKQATVEEVHTLIQWLKEEGSFSAWADEEWEAVASDMNPMLQQKLFRQIKEQIATDSTETTTPAKPTLRKRSLYFWARQVAAVLLLLLSTGSAVYFYSESRKVVQDMVVDVEKGQKAKITLPDGTLVWINSDSKLTYGNRFDSDERVVHLEGEAYFEVTPDKERPFTVETGLLSVTALGTSFNVKSYAEEQLVSATLMTGKIEVRSVEDSHILLPNQKLIFNKQTGQMDKSTIENAENYAFWKYNSLHFDAETFENIAHTLERYYNTQIVFESESLKKYRFTGSPGNTSLESILQILSLTSPLSYEVKDNVIILRENTRQKAYYEKALK